MAVRQGPPTVVRHFHFDIYLDTANCLFLKPNIILVRTVLNIKIDLWGIHILITLTILSLIIHKYSIYFLTNCLLLLVRNTIDLCIFYLHPVTLQSSLLYSLLFLQKIIENNFNYTHMHRVPQRYETPPYNFIGICYIIFK